MALYPGRVVEIRLNQAGTTAAWIATPQQAIPAPGRYMMAGDLESILPVPLFCAEESSTGFLTASPIPSSWQPGKSLSLWGPLGHGFTLPHGVRNLSLIALGESAGRLLPLATQLLTKGVAITLVTDITLPPLPSAIESSPTNTLDEILPWADFIAIDLPLTMLPNLRETLGLSPDEQLACPAQVLVMTAMPCGGIADCAVCAVPARKNWKLACKDGPVFDLNKIVW
jgi:NAD(P)H-flavin reductase